MKHISTIAAALAAGSLALAGGAYAHPGHHDNGKHLGWHKKHKHARRHVRYVEPHRVVRTERVVVYERGQYLPPRYYSNQTYYIAPTAYSLPAPPPGYQWVRAGDNVYLTQTTTGLIADVVANLFR
ncbi:MAG: RcnB family protein [Ignavibacteriales bacterium]